MPTLSFVNKAFAPGVPREYAEYYLLYALEALCRANMKWLEMYPDTPYLYESGVRYAPEDGTEEWCDIPTILEKRAVDCEDLACYRIAELRMRKRVRCRPFIRWRYRLYHVLVAIPRPNGRLIIEDPSKRLGMNGEG